MHLQIQVGLCRYLSDRVKQQQMKLSDECARQNMELAATRDKLKKPEEDARLRSMYHPASQKTNIRLGPLSITF